jgi:CTP:molybdopterin cytidylyltransferase MocA
MALHCIITAGGSLPRALRRYSASPVKALLPLGGRTLLAAAADAALSCTPVERVVAVGGAEVQAAVAAYNAARAATARQLEWAALGATVMDNIYHGFQLLGGEEHEYLILSPDLPFITAAALSELVVQVRGHCEFAAPLISAADFLTAFPGAPNCFEHINGQRVTMGSVLFFSGRALQMNVPLGRDFFRYRKWPHRLAALLGLPILWGYLTRTLQLATLERRARALMGVEARGIWVRDAGIAYDVDNAVNYAYALRRLEERG